eukprot:5335007-Amphidinium_carterae.1
MSSHPTNKPYNGKGQFQVTSAMLTCKVGFKYKSQLTLMQLPSATGRAQYATHYNFRRPLLLA